MVLPTNEVSRLIASEREQRIASRMDYGEGSQAAFRALTAQDWQVLRAPLAAAEAGRTVA